MRAQRAAFIVVCGIAAATGAETAVKVGASPGAIKKSLRRRNSTKS